MNIQDWLKSTFHLDNNVSASIIVTLTVFLSGWILSWIARGYANYKVRSHNRAVLGFTLNSLTESTKNQYGDFLDILLQIKRRKMVGFTKQHYPEIDVLLQIPARELYSTYFSGIENHLGNISRKRKKTKRLFVYKLRNVLSGMRYWENTAMEDLKGLKSSYHELTYELSALMNEFRYKMDRFGVEMVHSGKVGQEENNDLVLFMATVARMRINWDEDNEKSWFNIYEKFLKPMFAECRKPALPPAVELGEVISRIIVVADKLTNLYKGSEARFEFYVSQFEKYSLLLAGFVKNLHGLAMLTDKDRDKM
jgi:hypothetical protein